MEVAKQGDIHLPELNPLINKNGDVNQQISKTKPTRAVTVYLTATYVAHLAILRGRQTKINPTNLLCPKKSDVSALIVQQVGLAGKIYTRTLVFANEGDKACRFPLHPILGREKKTQMSKKNI